MDTTIRNVPKKCGVFPPSKYQGKDASFVKLSSTIEVAIPLTMGKIRKTEGCELSPLAFNERKKP